jgi:dipeptidyl aminopeptidase/acylaminoacyl peptidase
MVREPQLDNSAPWKQRFRAPIVARARIARLAPTRGLVMSNRSGIYQLYTWDVPTGELKQLTSRPEGVSSGVISREGHYVYYLNDTKGNEIGHFVRVTFEGGEPEDITPHLPPYASWNFTTSRDGNRIGFTVADHEGFHVYCIDVEPEGTLGKPRKLYHSTKLTLGPVLTQGGEIAFIASSERTAKFQFSLIAIDAVTGEQIAELWDGSENSLEPMVPSRLSGDARILASTNKTGIETLFVWDPLSGERLDLSFDLAGAARAFDWSEDGEQILLRTFRQAIQQLYIGNLSTGKVTRLDHPLGVNSMGYFAPNGEIWSHWQDSTHPMRLVALDRKTGAYLRTVLSAGGVPEGHSLKSITFRSSDGETIQGWLGLPDGPGPFPTILETHGGPTGVAAEVYSSRSQAWLDHGFAFLTLNYRGSVTFGRDFEKKIWGNIGHWELTDMIAAREWLVEQGISDAAQIFLTGWSYGGYLTLFALGKRPDLWAGGMAGIAIADWAVLFEDAADTLKAYDAALFEGTPQEKPGQYRVSSPITYAENVQAPVLIIQGRNDTRTPARQIEIYVEKMRSLGKSVDIHWFDAGHGSLSVEQNIEFQELMLRFAYQILSSKSS